MCKVGGDGKFERKMKKQDVDSEVPRFTGEKGGRDTVFKEKIKGTSLVAQWLRPPSHCQGPGLNPWSGN